MLTGVRTLCGLESRRCFVADLKLIYLIKNVNLSNLVGYSEFWMSRLTGQRSGIPEPSSLKLPIQQYTRGFAFWVVILIRLQRPDKGDQTSATEKQGNRDQNRKHIHFCNPTRAALKITVIEENDIANAAIRGVAYPATAIGIAMAL